MSLWNRAKQLCANLTLQRNQLALGKALERTIGRHLEPVEIDFGVFTSEETEGA